jgi:hypothetical protein
MKNLVDTINFDRLEEIYDSLQITIISDIINKIEKTGDITSYTKAQIKTLEGIDSKEVFYKALDSASGITKDTNKELKRIYEEYAHEDLKHYKQEFKYRGKSYKLNKSQLKILNQGLKATRGTLKNLVKTIAFQSEKLYVEAVDKAYMQVISGGIDYNRAIYNTYKELADSGVKLEDKLGRKVQLDVAVRRNVLSGVQQTTNKINKSLFKELGCDGYEVSAHSGARPTHAIAQGKQYALTREDAKKYGVGYWYDTVDGEPIAELWNDYNCRHSYFGIILGISQPNYDEKELEEQEKESVTYKGKEMPLYEAEQQQRYYERNIRAKKRAIESIKVDSEAGNMVKDKLKQELNDYRRKYREFNKETGLKADYTRTRI